MSYLRSEGKKKVAELTEPLPSVHGPPTKATIRPPVPGEQAQIKPAATLNATPVHLNDRLPGATGHKSTPNSSNR